MSKFSKFQNKMNLKSIENYLDSWIEDYTIVRENNVITGYIVEFRRGSPGFIEDNCMQDECNKKYGCGRCNCSTKGNLEKSLISSAELDKF